MAVLTQFPPAGKHIRRVCGDILEIRLTTDCAIDGTAFLSTNIGNAQLLRSEIIEHAENNIPRSGQDWRSIRMTRTDEFTSVVRLALAEEGHFEFKCCIVPSDDSKPLWVEGDNLHLNVSPASYCAADSVYCAFTRQFCDNMTEAASGVKSNVSAEEMKKFDGLNYALIPPSGTFRSLAKQLDHITGTLKCRIVHLLPVNPTPTVYGRMGRYGSPYASLDFTGIDPALAEFDRKATPLDQFIELADAIHARRAKLFIDIAINHTGWAAKLHETHPEWLVRDPDGTIHSPGAWGVTWGDLTELDHSRTDLWRYLADMFLVWCERGVDGFRCDAGYMIPLPAWEYITAKVRNEYPETVFLLEGHGGDSAVTRDLLDTANMDWAYSELFQNYSRQQVEGYLNYAWPQSSMNGLLIHYAETHDNARLAAVSHKYASMRTALAALASIDGAFGFANGVEWFATEKIDVHEASALNWGNPDNQIPLIARLNTLLAAHSAFHDGAIVEFIDSSSPNAVIIARTDSDGQNPLLAIVNLECDAKAKIEWDATYAPFDAKTMYDLISGRKIEIFELSSRKRSLTLPGGAFLCLAENQKTLQILEKEMTNTAVPKAVLLQEAKAMAARIMAYRNNSPVVTDPMAECAGDLLLRSPEEFLKAMKRDSRSEMPFVRWEWPRDTKRAVMTPPHHAILVSAPERFRCALKDEKGKVIAAYSSIKCSQARGNFALIAPPSVPVKHKNLTLDMTVFTQKTQRTTSVITLLAPTVESAVVSYNRSEIYQHSRTFMQANGRGAIMHQQMELGRLKSRYDALLLANLSPEYPEDRHIMLRRFRIATAYNARLQELKHEHITSFHVSEDGGGVWNYHVPTGNGMFVELTVKMEILKERNAVVVTFYRKNCENAIKRLPDSSQIRVIVTPDIEDRNFHYSTKAATGPEHYWPTQTHESSRGFEFAPAADRKLVVTCSAGKFVREDKWLYMNYLANEDQRGLDPHSDLYSPGAFKFSLGGNDTAYISAQITTPSDNETVLPAKQQFDPFRCATNDIDETIKRALETFIVKRGSLKTVIAGYPWFLDWGRDTLIAARGLVTYKCFRNDVKQILIQFARFEKDGTIPNMISGSNADNRDTSDAPLWLFAAVKDLCHEENSDDFLNTQVRDGQTLLEVLEQLAAGLMKGTPNKIKADPGSMLIFSPAHFTWMDTNYPAGTPREGYPVEIQALWYNALKFLAAKSNANSKKWSDAAATVKLSIKKYFTLKDENYLSDCLHCGYGTPAADAVPDDHLRPNQLFAVTFGAIDDYESMRKIVSACSELIVPGALRTLADKPVKFQLPIYGNAGQLLNDPENPYKGRYEGNEDTSRKTAYHNGTAWPWLFPSFCEAYFMTFGVFGRDTANSLLSSMSLTMDGGCITQIPEIVDGNFPHTPRGCDAQAWSMSELARVRRMLNKN